ncbi:hypothetical protein Naga_101904g1 [Nannochloropsis gaditana]|uniref:Uncharacterized protein n=1 Tax=Nannochloropsis gaditana TaxID=72520 RepID=W7T9B3_9STRA|nr:hypothetical protein Naga_101904g1 [Nannochloropsis gaditana]
MLNNALHAAMCHLNQSDTCKIMKAIEKGGDVEEAGKCIFFTRYAVPWVKGRVKAYLTGKLRSGPRRVSQLRGDYITGYVEGTTLLVTSDCSVVNIEGLHLFEGFVMLTKIRACKSSGQDAGSDDTN